MTIYVRNWRPNQLMFKHAGVKILLQRRGARDDNVALPDEALSNPDVARFLRTGKLERISEDGFNNLASRDEDDKMPAVVKQEIARIPITSKPADPNSPLQSTPTYSNELEARKVRTPQLEWESLPEATFPPYQGSDKDKAGSTNDPFGLTGKKKGGRPKKEEA